MASGEMPLRLSLDDIRPKLDAMEAEFRKVCAERDRLRAAIEFALTREIGRVATEALRNALRPVSDEEQAVLPLEFS